MSQNSLTLPTTGTVSGLQMTQYTNNALDTLNTLASGTSAPASPEAGQLWHDTTNNIIKIRSLDNTSWIALYNLNESAYLSEPAYSSQITGDMNRIINGGMLIDQVNEGASYTISTSNSPQYTADQWVAACLSGTASAVTVQRVTDAPVGFTNSLKVTVGTGASSVGTSDFLYLFQPIEANNFSDFNYGTVNAIAGSLSFWVKSSIAGTFAAVLQNPAGNRAIVNKFTIASAGVWQQITIPNIPGDTGGTWPSGNNAALNLYIVIAIGTGNQTSTLDAWQGANWLGSTSQTNSVLTTSAATFQISGVMFNPGAFCLPNQKRMIQNELQLCERYYQKTFQQGTAVAQGAGVAGAFSLCSQVAATFGATSALRTPLRTAPTLTTYNPVSANANWRDTTSNADRTAVVVLTSDKSVSIDGTSGAAGTNNAIHYSANARM